jgi:predicted dehydrogenase/nucleoside-diphosphate-sugar epimerase
MMIKKARAAIVGTGYIADFHALAIKELEGVELAAVCDANLARAKEFAASWNVPSAFESMDSMIQSERIDVVHVLVPPDLHYSLAKNAIQSGTHVFLEKPMCVSVEEADDLLTVARANNLRVGVNHNMLFSGAYQRLREIVNSKILGPIDYVSLDHFQELGPLRVGPFDSWMLRAPGNAILEIGPHLLSALLDLIGSPDALTATADREVVIPGGKSAFRRWRIHTAVGRTAVDININLGPGFNQRTINVRGLLGSATADFDSNTCTVDRRTPLGVDLDRFSRSYSIARQIQSQAKNTLGDYALSKLKLRRRGNPYQTTILDSVACFYDGLGKGKKLDNRIDGEFGRKVIDSCVRIIQAAGLNDAPPAETPRLTQPATKPTVLVIGAAGFIGRELVRQLLGAGYTVRAAVRSSSAVLQEFVGDHLEIVRGDLRNRTDLDRMLDGIEYVFHLAYSQGKTWDDSLRNDVEPTRLLAEVCLAKGIKRLIYTGTIDAYYAGAKAGTITEQTPLDVNIGRRNYYARAKAAAEAILLELHRSKGLPVVIFRPGIVIGQGGNPFHWGVGMWISEGVCDVWGDGRNKLPFVLVTDVAAALVKGVQIDGIEGRSYNLVDTPLLTARDYLDEIEKRAGMKLRVRYQPIWRFYATDLSKWLVKMAVRHPDRSRVPSYDDWESRTQKATFDSTRARSELNWVPASDRQRMLEEGIGVSLQGWLAAAG